MPHIAEEKHYSVPEAAELWGVSRATIRRIFASMPGVIKLGHLDRKGTGAGRRRHVTLSIPASLLQKVHAQVAGDKPFLVPVAPKKEEKAA